MIDLSVVIVSFNTEKLTLGAVNSVIKNTKKASFEIIVVDNNSADGSVNSLRKVVSRNSKITLIENNKNVGFGEGNNRGMKISRGRYILLLNSDTLVKDDALSEMVSWMDNNPKVGIASCGLRFPDDSVQGTGGYFPTIGRVAAWMTFLDDVPGISSLIHSYHPMHGRSFLGSNALFFEKKHEMDWLTAAFFLIRRETFEEVGYFDKDYFMYVEEVDYCFRAKSKRWQIWYLPKPSIVHYGGASSAGEYALLNEVKGLKVFYRKHMPAWQYSVLIFFMKLGMLLRIIIFGEKYAKIFVSV